MSRQRVAVVGGTAGIGAGLVPAAAARGLDVVVLAATLPLRCRRTCDFSRPHGAAATKILFEIASRPRAQGANGA